MFTWYKSIEDSIATTYKSSEVVCRSLEVGRVQRRGTGHLQALAAVRS